MKVPTLSERLSARTWASSLALIGLHALLLGLTALAFGRVHFASRFMLVPLLALCGGALIIGLQKLPAFHPPALRSAVQVAGYVWTYLLGIPIILMTLLMPLTTKEGEVHVGTQRVAGYVSCDTATTDPCILIRQVWSVLPGVTIFIPLYGTKGRSFTLTPIDSETIRVSAPHFDGEVDRQAIDVVLKLQTWSWR